MPEDIHSDQPSNFQSDLRSIRPDLRRAQFYCVKCRKEPRGWASTATHIADPVTGLPGGDGYIRGALNCHGETIEIAIRFCHAARYMENGEKIPVFDSVNQFKLHRVLGPDGKMIE